ncbi:hypothetical protein ABIE26_003870 [Pedobacter africanus]|uniref:Uncharacterized protein n=1 Tax=Pedobacter africanus TaxID=151894 RepID=A0ACC6L122_9SPHI|nr:hypothetical protein [Pedobacter africanus]MDR6785171.1 hypothetical protein [Pedobacter africanus]
MKHFIFYIALLIMLPNILQAQTSNTYQMEVEGLSAKTIDGGYSQLTIYLLRFMAENVGFCNYTIETGSKKGQFYRSIKEYTNWQYFKWQKHNDRLTINGLPALYKQLAVLQVKADTLIAVKNRNGKFVKQKQPWPANGVTGKSYACKIGDNKYLALTFDKDSVWLEYWKNIDPNGKLLAYDGTQPQKKYKWMGYGKHILIPDCAEYPIVDFEANKLLVTHQNQQHTMTEEVPYRQPIACSIIEEAPVKKQSKGKRKKTTTIRVYKP